MKRNAFRIAPKQAAAALLARRELILRTAGMLTLTGFAGGRPQRALAQSSSTAIATPQQTEGPYWVDERLNRQDLLVDPTDNTVQSGLPLVLIVTVSQRANGAVAPLSGAYVDIWHCNAQGVYSDEQVQGSLGKKFLRGYQATDDNGAVRFLTIYPGWYSGRAVHIHSRVRLFSGDQTTTNFTTQFFFDDAITDQVFQEAAYNQRRSRDTLNTSDSIYNTADCVTGSPNGAETMLQLSADSAHAVGRFDIVLDLTSSSGCAVGNPGPAGTGAPPGGSPPPGGGPGGR